MHVEKKGSQAYHDVYPHMFSDWCANFWSIFENDLGLKREEHFEPRYSVKLLKKGSPTYLELTNGSDMEGVLQNLRSGVVPPEDMLISGYSKIDLAASTFHPSEILSSHSANGFLHSRPYATNDAARLQDMLLLVIWSLNSNLTSASDYKDFIKYGLSFPERKPFAWMLKGNLQDKLIGPLVAKLEEGPNKCKIKHKCKVTAVEIVDRNGPVQLSIQEAAKVAHDGVDGILRKEVLAKGVSTAMADYVVFALPPEALSALIEQPVKKKNERVIHVLPELSTLRRLRAEPIPTLDLYFKRKLPDIPKEHVGLQESDYSLTFIDISQLWGMDELKRNDPHLKDVTVLTLAASDFSRLPPDTEHRQAHRMIKRLHEYLPIFNPGTEWGDLNSDIDWDHSYYRPNQTNKLFINEVGSNAARQRSLLKALPCVRFAGDWCRSWVDMATIESAVMTGLYAARSICKAENLGTVRYAETPSHQEVLTWKLALSPYAYAAKWWSTAATTLPKFASGQIKDPRVTRDISVMNTLPLAFAADWCRTASDLWLELVFKPKRARPKDPEIDASGIRDITETDDVEDSDDPADPSGMNKPPMDPAAELYRMTSEFWQALASGRRPPPERESRGHS